MSEHTYCDRCGMEITGERHCMGEGATGPIFPWFHPKFDLCNGCFKDWENWLPRSTRPETALEAPVQAEGDVWVELTSDWRVRPDGSEVQMRGYSSFHEEYIWQGSDNCEGNIVIAAYRKGLKVAHAEYDACDGCPGVRRMAEWHAEHEALREQVKALVEAVERAAISEVVSWQPMVGINTGMWGDIVGAAKAVQL